ncbi:leucyl/phenylalanyl-tRNA--protein transferase [Dermatophilus congolensis]|uniref:Leucyl/phenylalanyl-tRNA--protein transferase n=1 Tax=Dermatophilus congolensis TaxID=1863 RepID=A0A239VNJ2_9MICO|nr:leucyl/phenylalanyl-tRNA--protein transferase [Dermatophilus congolensis]SNV23871.1 Leucyl/phenylalanyl-tRNA--protein transferase [Dermatophilus congolensis]
MMGEESRGPGHPVFPPVVPGSRSGLPSLRPSPEDDLVGVGGDLNPATLLHAYINGVFPMGLGECGAEPMGWWSPLQRGVLRPADLRVHRSLRKSARHYMVSVDRAFEAVMRRCADPNRQGRWITDHIVDAYVALHEMGWAHSVEVWSGGDLVGGLYGVSIGGLFAGESMFHASRDASKVALMELVDIVGDDGDERRLIDVQWATAHLASLGVSEISRDEYIVAAQQAVQLPVPAGFASEWARRHVQHCVI